MFHRKFFLGICFFTTMVLSRALVLAQPAATSPSSDVPDDKEWTYAKVLAAVAWREGVLAQCSLSLRESTYLTQGGKNEFYCETRILDMYRRDGGVRFDVKRRYSDPTWNLDRSWSESWDGKVNRNLQLDKDATRRPLGAVSAKPPPLLSDMTALKACQVLGIGSPMGLPLSAIIKTAVEQGKATVNLSRRQENGEKIIVLKMMHPKHGLANDQEYWFLPNHDFALMKIKFVMFSSTDYDEPAMASSEFVITDHKQFDGFWLPSRFTYAILMANKSTGKLEAASRCEGEIINFSIVKPTDQQMLLTFPPRSRVVDTVAREAYTIQSDGSYLYEDMVDGETGRIIKASKK